MISEFDAFMGDGLGEALPVFGQTAFTIDGRTYQGDLSELAGESYTIIQGGLEIEVRASLLCEIGQFGAAIPKAGSRLKIGSRLLVIAGVTTDATSVTFGLGDPDAS